MSIPGTVAVSPKGTATYNVPIQLPTGVAGMAPSLSLAYDSQTGNGLLGVGWNLTGLSVITRCPPTLAQDGVRGRVSYSTTDRYCMDGQRLILVSGTEGAAGAEYRLEKDDATKITASSETGATGGPGSFVVKTKAGITMEFGKTADSRIEAQGKTVVIVWAVNKVKDTKGNYYAVSYNENNTNGEFYPASIAYTANDTASPVLPAQYTVYFDYETRTDVAPKYYEDSLLKTTQRLTKIRTHYGTQTTAVSYYQLGYTVAAGTKKSLLTTLSLCGTSCLPAMQFGYDASTLQPSSWQVNAHGVNNAGGWAVIDLFGDGRPVYWTSDGQGAHFASRLNADGTVQNWNWSGGVEQLSQGYRILDLFGDGRPVYWTASAGIHKATRLNPDGTVQNWTWQGQGLTEWGFDFVDAFGDGHKIYWTHDQYGMHWGSRFNADGSVQNWTWSGGHGIGDDRTNTWVDVFGDGRPIYWTRTGGTHYGTRLNDNGTVQNWTWSGHAIGDSGSTFVDFFGDGRPVYWTHHINGWHFATRLNSDGTSKSWTWQGQGVGDIGWRLVNLFGDGRMVYWTAQGTTHYLSRFNPNGSVQNWTVNGHGFAGIFWDFINAFGDGRDVYWTLDSNGHHYLTRFNIDGSIQNEDFQGHLRGCDGQQLTDLLGEGRQLYWAHCSYQHSITRMSKGEPDQLKTVNNGLGATLTINTARLPALATSDPVQYVRDRVSSYPQQTVTPAVAVVKDLSVSNGVGGTRTTTYKYANLVNDISPTGHGMLGFQWTQQQDTATGLVSRTYYRQDWPLIGMPYRVGRGRSEALWSDLGLNETLYTFFSLDAANNAITCVDTAVGQASSCGTSAYAAGRRYLAYAHQADSSSWDWDGSAMPRTRVRTQNVDIYGNVGKTITDTLTGTGAATDYSKTVTNTYAAPDTANWILGRLLTSKADASGPSLPASVTPGSGGLPAAPPPKLPAQVLLPILSLLLDD